MEGEIYEDVLLDCAVFQRASGENSYEALVYNKGKAEALASGNLDHLSLHLPEARGLHTNPSKNSFKLQLKESQKGSSWFTKFTLARFLHIVNAPEAYQIAIAIANEMCQLEETRKFHLALYSKDADHSGGGTADHGCLKEVGLTQKIKVETASSDATKNELLRAMDLRLMALREELAASFNRAAGATCSTNQISDLVSFAQHFGAVLLRDSLLKLLALIPKDLSSGSLVKQSASLNDVRNNCENVTDNVYQQGPQTDAVKPAASGVSPAKIAQAERQSSSESEDSSESSDDNQASAERSRPLIRSASPRRSASPMRRIQIGRSGSRRSTPLTIKSLNYFPARERTSSVRDVDGSNSDEEAEQPQKKPENTVRRMSVQDAISLFESKQKDQNSDIQKRRASGDVSVSTTKSVLRRWSAGMGDSFSHCSHESAADASTQAPPNNLSDSESKLAEVNVEPIPGENSQVDASPEVKIASPPMEIHAEPVVPRVEESNDRAIASAEWSRQKEAELNQMLMKMMESKSDKHCGTPVVSGGYQDISSEQRGGFYSQYKEKRDEKLRAENAGKRAAKEAQIKVMKETLEQSKAAMASNSGHATGKKDSPNISQRPRRNSSSPVIPKKEVSKSSLSKKAPAKTSPLPATRNSWSSGSLTRASGSPATKVSPGKVSSNSTPNRRKPQSTPSPIQPSPRSDRPIQQSKGKKGTPAEIKPSLKEQEVKKQRALPKTEKSVKTRSPAASTDDSSVLSAKPSFYSKVTKKSSVVPLEAKPFLRKGTGVGPGVGPALVKTKVSQSDDSLKSSGNLVPTEENVASAIASESTTKLPEDEHVQIANVADANLDVPPNNETNLTATEESDQRLVGLADSFNNAVELAVPEIQPDEDLGISSAAWVEVERQEVSPSCYNGMPEFTTSPGLAQTSLSSPRVRHSLSQMLQADSNEPEVIEWGNAENPPALVYQKDAPKGFKRLLKFARKSKGDANVTGWASPSVFSEGEDDSEESRAASRRSSEALLKKAALQSSGYAPPKTTLTESFDGGNSSKRSMDYRGMHDILSAQSSIGSTTSDKYRDGHISASAASTKATRSFFSLSTFRSNKSSETKFR